MLFFRSEERVDEWCREQGVPRRPILSLDQLWKLGVAWYENRLTTRSAASSRGSASTGLSGIRSPTSSGEGDRTLRGLPVPTLYFT